MDTLQGPEAVPALRAAGLDDERAHLLGASHRHTWFSIQGLEDQASFERGTLPGDPLGDMVFTCVMTRAL
eukprot:4493716-Alexandrium_andersonii.AAC.1